MARTLSTMLPLGAELPRLSLETTDGVPFDAQPRPGRPVLIVFICNHCPFVKHLLPVFSSVLNQLSNYFQVYAINSNDISAYPEDAPRHMEILKEAYRWTFPYLLDPTQETAKAFQAACTPDFFMFDRNHTLFYRGQFDESRPGNGVEPTGASLLEAAECLLKNQLPPSQQLPSLGCNIKWKPGNEPPYF